MSSGSSGISSFDLGRFLFLAQDSSSHSCIEKNKSVSPPASSPNPLPNRPQILAARGVPRRIVFGPNSDFFRIYQNGEKSEEEGSVCDACKKKTSDFTPKSDNLPGIKRHTVEAFVQSSGLSQEQAVRVLTRLPDLVMKNFPSFHISWAQQWAEAKNKVLKCLEDEIGNVGDRRVVLARMGKIFGNKRDAIRRAIKAGRKKPVWCKEGCWDALKNECELKPAKRALLQDDPAPQELFKKLKDEHRLFCDRFLEVSKRANLWNINSNLANGNFRFHP